MSSSLPSDCADQQLGTKKTRPELAMFSLDRLSLKERLDEIGKSIV
jgi:hypothetical protein